MWYYFNLLLKLLYAQEKNSILWQIQWNSTGALTRAGMLITVNMVLILLLTCKMRATQTPSTTPFLHISTHDWASCLTKLLSTDYKVICDYTTSLKSTQRSLVLVQDTGAFVCITLQKVLIMWSSLNASFHKGSLVLISIQLLLHICSIQHSHIINYIQCFRPYNYIFMCTPILKKINRGINPYAAHADYFEISIVCKI